MTRTARHHTLTATTHAVPAPPSWGLTQVLVAVRWAALVLAVLDALLPRSQPSMLTAEIIGATVLTMFCILRSIRPVGTTLPGVGLLVDLVLETSVCLAVIFTTGGWASPFNFCLGATLLIGGLAGGLVIVLDITSLIVVGAAISWIAGGPRPTGFAIVAQRAVALVAVAAVAAYGERVLNREVSLRTRELERLRSASEVNSLLLELHKRAADQPGSLSLGAAVATTVTRLRQLLNPDLVVLLLRDPTAEGTERPWQVAVAEGLPLAGSVANDVLPASLREATTSRIAIRRSQLAPGDGLSKASASGIYVPLWARQTLVGVLAIEREPHRPAFDDADAETVAEVAQHAGLAIDNARWFRRLRALGAEEERGRIARELHDQVGQSLAAVGISLEGLAGEARDIPTTRGSTLEVELDALAHDVRTATRHIREKLSDLRSDTSSQIGVGEAISDLLYRVEKRSSITTEYWEDCDERLPAVTEREVWRIAQEAISNAERHSGAATISASWALRGHLFELIVRDDGCGMSATTPLRRDAFGLFGMRERADSIGASLVVESAASVGTVVRLRITGDATP